MGAKLNAPWSLAIWIFFCILLNPEAALTGCPSEQMNGQRKFTSKFSLPIVCQLTITFPDDKIMGGGEMWGNPVSFFPSTGGEQLGRSCLEQQKKRGKELRNFSPVTLPLSVAASKIAIQLACLF